MLSESIIEPFLFRGHQFFVKRDDLIDPLLSGNKYRKLYTLVQAPRSQYKKLISYGGTQSNAMLSITALCHQKGWSFHYTSKPVPARLKEKPTGNLELALELGMRLHEVPHDEYDEVVHALKSQADDSDSTLFVPQGGADPIAQAGIGQLAREIRQWQQKNGIESLYVVTPSGTGTTAFYLAEALNKATVLTTPSVGDKAYLIEQMELLGLLPENLRILGNSKKHHFAKPYPEFLHIWQELKNAGIEFDLIYAALMWDTLLQHINSMKGTILYVHSGGLIGNATMLERYRHKGMIAER